MFCPCQTGEFEKGADVFDRFTWPGWLVVDEVPARLTVLAEDVCSLPGCNSSS